MLAQVLSVVFVILCILPLHEFAHGWVANKLGDPTAKLEGRLTLNPLASVDPMGALALILFGFGWAKPVPVNTRYFKQPQAGYGHHRPGRACLQFAGGFGGRCAGGGDGWSSPPTTA